MATRSSWRAAGSSTTLAPSALTAERTVANASGSVLAAGVRTQVAPSNMSGSEPSTPSCSEPAIGWPPTKRGWSSLATIGPLIPATSVTYAATFEHLGGDLGHGPGGVATKVIRADSVGADLVDGAQLQGPVLAGRITVTPGHPPAPLAQALTDGAADEAGADDMGPRPGAVGGAGVGGHGPKD